MRKLSLGDVEIYVLDDGSLRCPASAFFANVPEAVWRAQARPDHEGKIPVGHNCALVRTQRELIVIDTGYGDDTHAGATGHLLEDLARTGYRCDQVSIVVSTHAHGDHIKRNTIVRGGKREPTFPQRPLSPCGSRLCVVRWCRPRTRVRRARHDARAGRHARARSAGSAAGAGGAAIADTRSYTGTHERADRGRRPHADLPRRSLPSSAAFRASRLGQQVRHRPHVTPSTRETLFRRAVETDATVVCPHAMAPGLGKLAHAGGRFQWVPVV
jgi:Metallo-beta-lactamase superfamily